MDSKLIILRMILIILTAAMLSACFNRDRQPIYAESTEVEPIRVPEGLDQPPTRSAYQVPGYYLPELAARGNEDRPPRVLPSAEAEASNSHIRFGNAGLYLEVRDDADSLWRRLGFTLNRSGMSVREIDENERRYRFQFSHEPIEIQRQGLGRLAFWRGSEEIDYSGTYQAQVMSEGEERARVNLLDANGNIVDMDRAEYVLSVLRERLG